MTTLEEQTKLSGQQAQIKETHHFLPVTEYLSEETGPLLSSEAAYEALGIPAEVSETTQWIVNCNFSPWDLGLVV